MFLLGGMKGRGGIYARRILAQNVRRLRKARKMSQEELADSARVAQSQISKIERAIGNVRLDVLYAVSIGLRARMSELLEEKD